MNYNDDFSYKLYMAGLPDYWDEDPIYCNEKRISKSQKKILNNRYKDLQNIIISNDITLQDILELDTINIKERLKLAKIYAYKNKADNPRDFFKINKKLKKLYNYYKNKSKQDLINNNDKKKKIKKLIDKDMNVKEKLLNEIMNLNISDENKSNILKKYYEFIHNMKDAEETIVIKKWLNYIIQIPFNKYINCFDNNNKLSTLRNIKDNLDKNIYGMNDVKEKILLLVNNKYDNIDCGYSNIALVGPPGIGKTSIVNILSSCLTLPFKSISMGGISDNSFLIGHSSTYIGSKPGIIIETLKEMKNLNGIIFFDEIDKTNVSSNGSNVINQLIHITDPTQNNNFYDNFIEIPVDLSKIWFFFSLNDINKLDPILKNRLYVIYLNGYSNKEKLIIIKNFVIPKLQKKYLIYDNIISFPDETINYIINITENESGIRHLERNFEDIFKKIKFILDTNNSIPNLSFSIDNIHKPLILEIKYIDKLIKKYNSDIPFGIYL